MAAIYTDQVTAKASNSEPPTGSFKKSSFEKGLFLPSLGNWKRQPNNNNKNLLTSSCPTPTKHQQKKKTKTRLFTPYYLSGVESGTYMLPRHTEAHSGT